MSRLRTILSATALMLSVSASALALTVEPSRTEVRLLPGGSLRMALRVRNETDARVRVDVSQKDWFVLPQNQAIPVAAWMKIGGRRSFDLKPGRERTIPLKLTCPKEAVGDLVGMVSFGYVGDGQAMIKPMISVSVYLTAQGTEVMSGEIRDLRIRGTAEKLEWEATLRSTGNVHLRPTGRFRLLNERSDVLAEVPLRSGSPAYPGVDRAYNSVPQDLKVKPGRYTAAVEMEYGDWKAASKRALTIKPSGEIQMEEPSS